MNAYESLQDDINNNNVQVIWLGDNLTIVLDSDAYFVESSANLVPVTSTLFTNITQILNSYTTVGVTVSGYTDKSGWAKRDVALSQQRATIIANYLWQNGVNTRLLSAEGYGAAFPIASNATAWGRQQNLRIEITTTIIQ